jgi:hypothetical protein
MGILHIIEEYIDYSLRSCINDYLFYTFGCKGKSITALVAQNQTYTAY